MGREGETKAEKKERKRLKKLAKEAKNAKKRKLDEVEQDSDEKVESPKSKKRKLSSDSDKSEFKDITKVIVGASKEQLQNALLQCAKQTPSNIPAMETNLEADELDSDLDTMLKEERANAPPPEQTGAAVSTNPDDPVPSAGKVTGVIAKWNHEKGFGFITRDDGKGDLFCHRNDVYAEPPFENARTGSRVEFMVEKDSEKGDRASEVSAIGGGNCEGGRQCVGRCERWLPDRGFGFVSSDADGSQHIVFDRDCYTATGMLQQGQRVQFDIKTKDDGRTSAIFVADEACNNYRSCRTCEGYGLCACRSGGGGGGGGASADTSQFDFGPEEEWEEKEPTPGKTVGTVLQWKHERGFGFIKTDEGKELFCHTREVWAEEPHRNARVGTRVEFDVTQNDKGESATNVQRLGGGNCRGGRQMVGFMLRWIEDKGFGFARGRDGNDYFVPDREVWDQAGCFAPGDKVLFDIKTKTDGRTQAIYVSKPDTPLVQCQLCEGYGHMAVNCQSAGNLDPEAVAEAGADAGGW